MRYGEKGRLLPLPFWWWESKVEKMKLKNESLAKCFKACLKAKVKGGLKPHDLNIVFDLDNTLALLFDFHEGPEKALASLNEEGFFRNLPLLDEDAPEVLRLLQVGFGYNIYICSKAAPTAWCASEKREWVHTHFPFIEDDRIVILDAEDHSSKAEAMEKLGLNLKLSFLVDDFGRNLDDWVEKGGLPIKKSYSGKQRNVDSFQNYPELIGILQEVFQ